MWRACPIPSANTVAQKPPGKLKPLSSVEQAWFSLLLESLWADFRARAANIKATAYRLSKIVFLRAFLCTSGIRFIELTSHASDYIFLTVFVASAEPVRVRTIQM